MNNVPNNVIMLLQPLFPVNQLPSALDLSPEITIQKIINHEKD